MENQLFTTLKLNRLCKNVNFSKIHLDGIKGQIISIREGEVLFREGDSADSIFLIVSGEINIIKKKLLGKTKSYIYNENTFLGQEDFLEEMSRSSIAVALRDSYLVSLSKEEIDRLTSQDGIIAENLKVPIFEFEEDNINREQEEPEYDNIEEAEPETNSNPDSDFSEELEIPVESNFDFKEVKKKEKTEAESELKANKETVLKEKTKTAIETVEKLNGEVDSDDNSNASDMLATFDHDFLNGLLPKEEPKPIPEVILTSKQASPWDVTPDFDFTDSDMMKFVVPKEKTDFNLETEIKSDVSTEYKSESGRKTGDLSELEIPISNEEGDVDFSSLDEEFNKHLLYAENFEIPEDEPIKSKSVNEINLKDKPIDTKNEQNISNESNINKKNTKEDYESFLDEELFKLLEDEPYQSEKPNPKEISMSDLENEEIFKGLNFAEETNEEIGIKINDQNEDELNNALFDLLNETDNSGKKIKTTSEMDFTDFNFDDREQVKQGQDTAEPDLQLPEPEIPNEDIPEDIPNPKEPEIEIPEELPNPKEPESEIPEEDIPNPKEPEIEIPEEEIPKIPKPELPVNKGPRKSYAEQNLSSETDFRSAPNSMQSYDSSDTPKSSLQLNGQNKTDLDKEEETVPSNYTKPDSSLFTISSPGAPTNSLDSNQLKKIISASELVNSQVKIDDVLQSIVDVGIDLTNCDRGTLYIVDKSKNEIWSKIAIGSETKEIRLKIGEGLAGHVALTGVTLNIKDVQSDKRFNPEYDIESGYKTKNMICFPIKNREKKIIGVLQLINSKTGSFTKLDEEFLEAISIQSAIAIQNAEMVEKLLQAERIQSLGKMTNFLIQDIKKPILVSKRYTEHLKNKELPDEVTKLIDMILEQLNQVADIVTTTSSYSDGTTILRTINLSLNNTLTDYFGRIEMYVKGKGCRIINEFDKDVTIKLDMKEFYQCYMHIIKNACDAMPEGGIVEISTKKEGKTIKIFFKDNGIGIDDNLLEKIFDPFSSFGKKEGTGLGLSITRKVVEAHNGKLEVFSKIGEGSTFVITLPIVLAL
ncbi:MAG: ATP-binding protein [Melioribacteraceae bacterium]|nr:ATP-binding protein [Melioribacteraceae bacterium]